MNYAIPHQPDSVLKLWHSGIEGGSRLVRLQWFCPSLFELIGPRSYTVSYILSSTLAKLFEEYLPAD